MDTKFVVGQRCTCRHPYAYRANEPCTIIEIIPDYIPIGIKEYEHRPVYKCRFDSKSNHWSIKDIEENDINFVPIGHEEEYRMELI